MRPESRLLLVLTLWISICLVFVRELEVLFVLVLLCILVLRVLTDLFTSRSLKDRVDFFIYTFLLIFGLIVIRRIFLILSL